MDFKLEQWPFRIYLVADDMKVHVIAVIHTSRSPNYISSRLT